MFIHSSPLFIIVSNCFSTSDIGYVYPLLCFGPEVAVINWYVTLKLVESIARSVLDSPIPPRRISSKFFFINIIIF